MLARECPAHYNGSETGATLIRGVEGQRIALPLHPRMNDCKGAL